MSMTKQLVTTIRWRPHPEQKPKKNGWYTVRYDCEDGNFEITSLGFYDGKWVESEDCKPIRERFDHAGWVTHFALPEDITTEETP